jgi:hypothetical protein
VVLQKRFSRLAASAAGLGTVTSALAFVGCSSGPAPATSPGGSDAAVAVLSDSKCTDGGLTVAFNPMYSAFDGTHTFQIPAVVVGSNAKVTWFADSTMVGMQADPERPNEVLLTMLKAGETTVHVQSADGKCGSAPLHISAALESDWEIGNKRYNDGVSVHLAGPPVQGTGSPLEMGGMGGPACTSCHGETATGGLFTNVSHTPEQTGGFSDAEILDIVLRGTFPPTDPFDWNIVPYPAWMSWHRWADITPDQQRGIIVYLRSLAPRPQLGAPNFGALDPDAGLVTIEAGLGADGVATGEAGEAGAGSGAGDAGEAGATD